MTRACPVEVHVCCSSRIRQRFPKCHGLAPWRLTLVATKASDNASLDATGLPRGGSRLLLLKHQTTLPWMPQACPVEVHVCCYSNIRQRFPGCHGLAPGRFTFAATQESGNASLGATGLPGVGTRCLVLTD